MGFGRPSADREPVCALDIASGAEYLVLQVLQFH
jgi:hypothetical protein